MSLEVVSRHLCRSERGNSRGMEPNEELYDLYSSPNIIRMILLKRIKWAGHVLPVKASRNEYKIFVGKCEVKRPLGRYRSLPVSI
jgi:hypothetical protein